MQATTTVTNQINIDTWDKCNKMMKAIIKININNFSLTGINPLMMSMEQLWSAIASKFE
jgi:hypothetical protein